MIVLGFYKYANIKDPKAVAKSLREFCNPKSYLGTILVSQEGLNGSVSANTLNTVALRKFLQAIPGFSELFFKEEETYEEHPFKKIKIKIKDEIVRFDFNVDLKNTGTHISPDEFLELYDDNGELKKDVVILDIRNDFEYKVGRFKGATHVNLQTFREFTKKVDLKKLKNKKVVMYCTGGVRCEKASAFVKEQGIKDVSQLSQGIIQFGKIHQQSVWEGKCFVFDKRMVSSMNSESETVSICHLCNSLCDFLRNCRNVKCNLFYVSCLDCEKTYNKCCSIECQKIVDKPNGIQQKKLESNKNMIYISEYV